MAIVIPAKGQPDWDVTLNTALVELESEISSIKAGTSVTGSRGGNAALASLITALASLGLITDNTTA
jgi:hypothetical protein